MLEEEVIMAVAVVVGDDGFGVHRKSHVSRWLLHHIVEQSSPAGHRVLLS